MYFEHKILIVDDSKASLELISSILKKNIPMVQIILMDDPAKAHQLLLQEDIDFIY